MSRPEEDTMNPTDLIARLRGVDPAAIADADKSIRVIAPEIRPVRLGLTLLGPAYTVRCTNDFFAIIAALADAKPGDVLVVDTQGSTCAVVGELFSLEAARMGLGGIVIDGACRDVSTIRTLDMPVYARSITPVSGTVNTLGERQVAIACGGVAVNPGDILFGDDDGIIVATAAELERLLPAAEAIKRTENAVIERLQAGESLLSVLNHREHAERLAAGDPTSKLQFKL
jgi:RraA family protein